jgi:hypothetical protein
VAQCEAPVLAFERLEFRRDGRPSGFAGFDEAALVGEDDGLDSVA